MNNRLGDESAMWFGARVYALMTTSMNVLPDNMKLLFGREIERMYQQAILKEAQDD